MISYITLDPHQGDPHYENSHGSLAAHKAEPMTFLQREECRFLLMEQLLCLTKSRLVLEEISQ